MSTKYHTNGYPKPSSTSPHYWDSDWDYYDFLEEADRQNKNGEFDDDIIDDMVDEKGDFEKECPVKGLNF